LNDAKLGALAAKLCEDMADRYGEEVACGSRFKIHGGPTVGRIHARQGERLNEGKHKRYLQGFDMGKGKSTCGVVTLREVGSANSSELEARPNGIQKRTEECIGGFCRTAEHGRNATNRRSGNRISEKEFTKTPNCFRDRYMGQSAAANCGEERGLASAVAKNHRCDPTIKTRALRLSANVSTRVATNWTATLAQH
jgi:hypothetical protein